MIDDIIYFGSLLICVSLGNYYKNIDDPDLKRYYGSGLGMLVACAICGQQIYHSVLIVWGNVIIIKCCDKRSVHLMSLGFTWFYLMFIHLALPTSKYVLWVYQVMALRLVGLAFEVNIAAKTKNDPNKDPKYNVLGDTDELEPTSTDIITYAFFFIGLHKGPYYTWRAYNNHILSPFGSLGNFRIITEQKIKKALFCALGYSLLRIKYSPKIYNTQALYNFNMDCRYLYNVPLLVMYFLKHQVVMLLCTSVCSETGFGVYPSICQPIPGRGPSAHPSVLKLAANSPDVALEHEYNFAMLKSFDNGKLMLGPKMRDTMKSWHMSTQYWFWAHIYKHSVKSNKEVRSACSFLAWTIWRGPTLAQVITSLTLWLYVHLESEYENIYDTTGSMKLTWDIGYSIMRILCLVYLTPCFWIQERRTITKYYNSLLWIYHVVLLCLIVAAVVIQKGVNNIVPQTFPTPLAPRNNHIVPPQTITTTPSAPRRATTVDTLARPTSQS